MTLIISYSLFITPLILVFPEIYVFCVHDDTELLETLTVQKCEANGGVLHKNFILSTLELIFDVFFCFEIFLNFFKKTLPFDTFQIISSRYFTTFFFFDIISTLPELFMGEGLEYFWLKMFRLVHVSRVAQPVEFGL